MTSVNEGDNDHSILNEALKTCASQQTFDKESVESTVQEMNSFLYELQEWNKSRIETTSNFQMPLLEYDSDEEDNRSRYFALMHDDEYHCEVVTMMDHCNSKSLSHSEDNVKESKAQTLLITEQPDESLKTSLCHKAGEQNSIIDTRKTAQDQSDETSAEYEQNIFYFDSHNGYQEMLSKLEVDLLFCKMMRENKSATFNEVIIDADQEIRCDRVCNVDTHQSQISKNYYNCSSSQHSCNAADLDVEKQNKASDYWQTRYSHLEAELLELNTAGHSTMIDLDLKVLKNDD